MKRYLLLFAGLVVVAVLLGCLRKNVPAPTADDLAGPPSMPPLGVLSKSRLPAPVFGPPREYAGSPLDEVGRRGLFGVHSPKSNRIALLKNGDTSFAIRVQLLEEAEKSIRIQALIFWGDESGLYIAEILKRKKAEGLDVRVIVDAGAKKSGGNVQIWEWYGWRYDQAQQTEGTIHAKYAVFDRRYSLVGSYNLDPRSEKLNSETAVVFESDILSTELPQIFYENDLAYSRRVTPKEASEYNEPTDALYKLRKEFGSLFESLL